jgi:hypothetical protein
MPFPSQLLLILEAGTPLLGGLLFPLLLPEFLATFGSTTLLSPSAATSSAWQPRQTPCDGYHRRLTTNAADGVVWCMTNIATIRHRRILLGTWFLLFKVTGMLLVLFPS